MIRVFKARVETGCSILGRCAFITVTYQAESREGLPAATYVRKNWAALWRRLRKDPIRQMEWLRVMEITKRGIPHHHLVAGPVEGQVRCYGPDFDMRDFRRRFASCECLSHRLSRHWLEVTGDSEIVHTVPVLGAKGAGSYMAKYLAKTFGMESRLRSVGMSRRWSSSRGWPGTGRLHLAQSDKKGGERKKDGSESGWQKRVYIRGHISDENLMGDGSIMDRAGNVLAVALQKKKEKKGKTAAFIRSVQGVEANR